MLTICPSCNSENRDTARYCDQCGAPLTPDAAPVQTKAEPAARTASSSKGVNWGGLAMLAVVLGVAGFLLFPGKKQEAGGPMGAGKAGEEVMGQVMEQVAALKTKLEADPLDTKTLSEVYDLYSQVGKVEKAREYVQLSLDGIKAKLEKKEIDTDKAISVTADVAQAAVMAGDGEGAMLALEFFHQLKPDDLRVLPFLGNLAYDLGKVDDAIKWYTLFLDQAEPDKFEEYWNVRIDRATMYLQKSDDTDDASWVEKAKLELEDVTAKQPKLFNAWFNLGQVYLHRKDKPTAREMFSQALTLASDEISKYKAEKEIALIDGKTPPAMPNPHGEGGSLEEMGLGPAKPGVANPHGEGFTGGTAPGMENPHGEGFGDVAPGMENPHGEGGMTNPHGEGGMANPHGEGEEEAQPEDEEKKDKDGTEG